MPMLRRRRPLLRAAAVGGGAYMAGKSRARSQEREYQQDAQIQQIQSDQYATQQAPPPAAPAAGGMSGNTIEQLKQLGALHEQGVLTDDEFTQQKGKLLAS
jgi:Short C-terminal domain